MRRLLTKSLWFSSLLLLVLSCKTIEPKYRELARTFPQEYQRAVYKTGITFGKHYFTGLLVVKSMPAATHRVVFITEMGMKIFDVEVGKESFQTHYVLSYLDRKVLLNTLEKDFRLLFFSPSEKGRVKMGKQGELKKVVFRKGLTRYIYRVDSTASELKRKKFFMKNLRLGWEGEYQNTPQKMVFRHYGIKLLIELQQVL